MGQGNSFVSGFVRPLRSSVACWMSSVLPVSLPGRARASGLHRRGLPAPRERFDRRRGRRIGHVRTATLLRRPGSGTRGRPVLLSASSSTGILRVRCLGRSAARARRAGPGPCRLLFLLATQEAWHPGRAVETTSPRGAVERCLLDRPRQRLTAGARDRPLSWGVSPPKMRSWIVTDAAAA